MRAHVANGHPLIFVFYSDIFDYIDIGALIPASGAVPVVIKSLVFSTAR